MKWRSALPLILIILLLSTPIVSADNTNLYVNGYNSVTEEWDETGASPWLDDNDGTLISTSVNGEIHSEFTFADTVTLGALGDVFLYLEINGPSARNDECDTFIHDGAQWNKVLDQDPDGDGYLWYNVNISSYIDTWAKVNNTKLYVLYDRVGSPATETIYVRRGYINVSYTAGAQTYNRDASQSMALTINAYRDWTLERNPTQSLTLTENTYREWVLERNPIQTLTSSLNAYRTWNLERNPDLSLTYTFNIYRRWDLTRQLTQSITFIWNAYSSVTVLHEGLASLALTLSSSIARAWSLTRNPTQTLTMTTNTYREWTLTRNPLLAITPQFNVYRTWSLIRQLTQSINFAWNAYVNHIPPAGPQTFNRLATLAMSITPLGINNNWILDIIVTYASTPIQGAIANLFNIGGSNAFTELTNSTGYIETQILPQGEYSLTVSIEDYQPYTLKFTLTQNRLLEIPLSSIEDGIMISLNIELLIFAMLSSAFLWYAWTHKDIQGIVAASVSFFSWIASGLWFMWDQMGTEKVHFWYYFWIFAILAFMLFWRNVLYTAGKSTKGSSWDEYY